jgi:hypothetical protein
LKDLTRSFYHVVKRAVQSDMYTFRHEAWLSDSKIWKEKLKLRMLNMGEATRLNYLLDIDAFLNKDLESIREKIGLGKEYSARNLLGDLYPYFVGIKSTLTEK